MPPGTNELTIETVQWYLTELGGSSVVSMATDDQPSMVLDPAQNQVSGFAGCNTFFGSYERDGASLKFGPLGVSRMACPDFETRLETNVLDALAATRKWQKEGNRLLLFDGNGVLARFSQEKHPVLIGPVWQWHQTLYTDDRKVVPASPADYTVQFQQDGTISAQADCNKKGGTYSIASPGKAISIAITQSTMAACPAASLEDVFVRGLVAGQWYVIRNDNLYIDLKDAAGTMRFTKK